MNFEKKYVEASDSRSRFIIRRAHLVSDERDLRDPEPCH